MTTDSYKVLESRQVDQELISHLLQAFETSDTFRSTGQLEDTQPTISIIDYPCGFGKTTTLIETIAQLSELKFLIVVQTLDEVRRVLQEAPEGRLKSPESPSTSGKTKSQQLEDLVLSGASIVITHALYERAGTLALEGGLNHYNVIIDEVPNAVTVARQVSFQSFQKHYLEPGYCEVAPSGLVSPTEKGLSEADSLKEVMDGKTMEDLFSGRLFHDGLSHLIQTIPVYLFTRPLSVTVLTFMAEGTLFTKFLSKSDIDYQILKGTGSAAVFRETARQKLSIRTIPALEDVSFAFNKQQSYRPKSQEVSKVNDALKNLRQRKLADVPLADLMVTCAKSNWYHSATELSKAGPFAKLSRMFKGANWVPNTTRGTNNYSHCSHAVYLYEQNANPVLLQWLGANTRAFRDAYALSEMIQWIWRTQIRNGEPVCVYMPSKKMRVIVERWLGVD